MLRQQAIGIVDLLQSFFRLFALGDVTAHTNNAHRVLIFISDKGSLHLCPNGVPIFSSHFQLKRPEYVNISMFGFLYLHDLR